MMLVTALITDVSCFLARLGAKVQVTKGKRK